MRVLGADEIRKKELTEDTEQPPWLRRQLVREPQITAT